MVIADVHDGEELVRNFNAKYGNGRTIFVKTDVTDKSSFESKKSVLTNSSAQIMFAF